MKIQIKHKQLSKKNEKKMQQKKVSLIDIKQLVFFLVKKKIIKRYKGKNFS